MRMNGPRTPRYGSRGGSAGALTAILAAIALAAGCGATARPAVTHPGGRAAAAAIPPSWSPQQLADAWDRERVSWPVPALVRHADVESRLRDMQAQSPDLFRLEEFGRSVEGRPLYRLWFGRGPLHVLLWSQMHGDEPTATAALFDVFDHVRRRRADPAVVRMLDALTIHAVPMLNPDGAERFQRRNAQGLDINRDALRLQTPEGRALKVLRDRLQPAIGFNLHNQGWRTSAGKTAKPASISLLSVAFDEPGTMSPGRVLTKKTAALIRDALEPLAPGRIARYGDEFEARAFGDNLTKWGTSVLLIETGPWPAADPDPHLVRLNFVALMTALDALATGRVARADERRYDSLPVNDTALFYLLIRNATVVPGTGVAPFIADIGIVAARGIREADGGREVRLAARIEDLGDLSTMKGMTEVDAAGLVVAPLWDPALKEGDAVALPDFSAHRAARAVAPGAPADLVILRPEAGRHRVVRVITH
ncbi:MAG TPA: M14 family zinc carboxypeptidase [Vicinamibacterales bacterium]|nr:M14 family zinc carboxypeptidase [Vicinamibacterales bacterium]HOQ59852.1 M14 family zinc carboxypeptidase [Vicinamibacterales bacterium]HPK70613.1 M14 family zinc carboxypeptidase [Vicinamibacterales bacterium]